MRKLFAAALALLTLSGCDALNHGVKSAPVPPQDPWVFQTQAQVDSANKARDKEVLKAYHAGTLQPGKKTQRKNEGCDTCEPRRESWWHSSTRELGSAYGGYSLPVVKYQNQFGGWLQTGDLGWIDMPNVMGGMSFHVNPNSAGVSIEAFYDGNPVGSGQDFGINNYHDNGQHTLVIDVSGSRPSRYDETPPTVLIKRFKITVFNKGGY